MSSYTFASKKHYRRYVFVVLLFYPVLFFSFLVYLINPQLFYWRAWEYFDEIVYKIPNAKPWKGVERGDQSRDYIYSFQNMWQTEVSCDFEGYRSVPLQSDSYPLLIVGDSNTWGSGLSDCETIPWILAKSLNVPIFNGARTPNTLGDILANPRVRNSKIIVELISEHLINGNLFTEEFQVKEPIPYKGGSSVVRFLDVHPKRYFLPFKLLRPVCWLSIFNEMTKKNLDSFMMNRNKIVQFGTDEAGLVQAVSNIEKRACLLKKLGYEYIVGVIPNRMTTLAKVKDPEVGRLRALLSELFMRNQVKYVDLNQPFAEYPEMLYFQNDTHLNAQGAALVAEILARYLQEHFKDPLVAYTNQG